MARSRPQVDLKELAKERYEGLLAEKNMIDAEVKAIEAYLRKMSSTVRRKKSGSTAHSYRSATTAVKTKKSPKGFATQEILSLIEKARKGISIDQMMEQTNLERQTVNGVLARMKREGKVKAAKRGVYVKA